MHGGIAVSVKLHEQGGKTKLLYLLREGGIENSVLAKARQQASCASEDSTKADILAKHQSPVLNLGNKFATTSTPILMISSLACYLLLLSSAICNASFTAVHRLMREDSVPPEFGAVFVTKPLKATLHLCLLKAERVRPAASMPTVCLVWHTVYTQGPKGQQKHLDLDRSILDSTCVCSTRYDFKLPAVKGLTRSTQSR